MGVFSWNTHLEERIEDVWTFLKEQIILWQRQKATISFRGIISIISRNWNCTFLVLGSYQSLLYFWNEICVLEKCQSGKCSFGEISVRKLSEGEMPIQGIVHSGDSPLGNYPSGNSPSGKCLQGTVHRGTVLEPSGSGENFSNIHLILFLNYTSFESNIHLFYKPIFLTPTVKYKPSRQLPAQS